MHFLKYRSRKIIFGFALIILIGMLLLKLPFATKLGQTTTWMGALFTSVSATCVTGLVVYDTYSHWTLFGQLVILLQIQIGGLGFVTIFVFMMMLLRRRIKIGYQMLAKDSISLPQVPGGMDFIAKIVKITLCIEGIGALLLAWRFIPRMGWMKGFYYGIFHSVSAFCNAGFDLMGRVEPYSSFVSYANDPIVLLTLAALIIIGGIGFLVWEDLICFKGHWKSYHLHTKMALASTGFLLIVGTILFFLFEHNGVLAHMNPFQQWVSSFFCAVTPRTAGFNSVDNAQLSNGALLLTTLLMFIGGSPGSTAGGVKTVTVFVLVLYISSYVARKKECNIFCTRLSQEALRRANVVLGINVMLVLFGAFVIFSSQVLPFKDVIFEVVSAIGTVGLSTGITRSLSIMSQLVLCGLMFCGRMGTLTFAMAFTEQHMADAIRHPEEDVVIG